MWREPTTVWGMANRTASSRTKGRASSSGSGSGARKRPPAKSTARTSTARKPPIRKTTSKNSVSRALFRGLLGGWKLLAKGVGGIARTVGRSKELDQAHRRDGLAFALIALGVIAGAGIWWRAAGPIGHYLEIGARSVVGAAAMALPLALLVIGIALMRSDPQPEKRPRLVIGSLLFILAILGMLHIISRLPEDNLGQRYAGGALGYFSGGLLSKGVTAWVAMPVLLLVLGFGVLVFTGTRFRDIPTRLREMGMDPEDCEAEGIDLPGTDEDPVEAAAAEGAEPARLRRPSRRRQASTPTGEGEQLPLPETAVDEEIPLPPEPPAPPPRKRKKPVEVKETPQAKEQQGQLDLAPRVVDGDYTLPD